MKTINYALYMVTDSSLMSTKTVEESVEAAIKGGCTVVQFREKHIRDANAMLKATETAMRVKEITDRYGVALIVNDHIELAAAIRSDGVHVGQDDLPAQTVRQMLKHKIVLGVSVTNKQQALRAEQDGADYLGVGAVFPTGTKNDAAHVTLTQLKEITAAVKIPVVAIGGIKNDNIHLLADSGISGVAVVSAIISQPDITFATAQLKKTVRDVLGIN